MPGCLLQEEDGVTSKRLVTRRGGEEAEEAGAGAVDEEGDDIQAEVAAAAHASITRHPAPQNAPRRQHAPPR